MAYTKGITERGYGGRKQGNPNKPERKTQEPDRLPMIADSDPAGNKITTNYPVSQSGNNNQKRSSGRDLNNQALRGYVRNADSIGVGKVESGNDRHGGPPTIHKISGP